MRTGRRAPAFSLKTFPSDCAGGVVVNVTAGLLMEQEHLVPVLEAVRAILSHGSRVSERQVIQVEGTAPVELQFRWLGNTVFTAILRRGTVDAVLVVVDSRSKEEALALTAILTPLRETTPAAYEDVVDWLTGKAAPRAALAYTSPHRGDLGVKTFAMCLASEALLVMLGTDPE